MSNNITIKNKNLTLNVTPPRQCITLAIQDPQSHSLFEETLSYDDLASEFKFIFGSVDELYDAMKEENRLEFDQNGGVTVMCSVSFGKKTVEKQMRIQLKCRAGGSDEMRTIRRDLQLCKSEVHELRHQINFLKEQNQQLSTKFKFLEQMEEMNAYGKNSKGASSSAQFFFPPSPPAEDMEPLKEEIQTILEQRKSEDREKQIQKQKKGEKKEVQEQPEDQEEKEGPKKYKRLPIKFSSSCAHLDKYKIQGQIITSLFEDYYQIYLDDPLPRKGIYLVRIRIPGPIHGSIGIIGESLLNNQYSFQNKKSICFYSYSYGNFRGVYTQGSYASLTWPIQPNQIVNIQLDLNKSKITYWMQDNRDSRQIDFSQLAEEQPLRFFFQLYEQGCSLQFL